MHKYRLPPAQERFAFEMTLPMSALCGYCEWRMEGPASEVLAEQKYHRETMHKHEIALARRRRKRRAR